MVEIKESEELLEEELSKRNKKVVFCENVVIPETAIEIIVGPGIFLNLLDRITPGYVFKVVNFYDVIRSAEYYYIVSPGVVYKTYIVSRKDVEVIEE